MFARFAATCRRAVVALALMTVPAAALQPDERLPDPALEARARTISAELRCVVCQNQSIDDSDAELARDLRLLVRERIMAGDDDAAVLGFISERYGRFVLLKPPFDWSTAGLWVAGPVVLLIGAGALLMALRRRRAAPSAEIGLSSEEEERLKQVLGRPDA
ncbi:cytochrome c-type biogenesis protein [Methylobrevis albus]|uniref:Cytochrome c-type biogenesis protein n=1 Tax=Methylobrevis albus TaxID=2793297 RepID=A0A931I1B6_9HYPH|nr:cytochrome c-type biogenesis protein [Methylobrevis albus]MBH0237589.1 cytochrome c-type biogenesis protein CcmH [Methylobrevis albus]